MADHIDFKQAFSAPIPRFKKPKFLRRSPKSPMGSIPKKRKVRSVTPKKKTKLRPSKLKSRQIARKTKPINPDVSAAVKTQRIQTTNATNGGNQRPPKPRIRTTKPSKPELERKPRSTATPRNSKRIPKQAGETGATKMLRIPKKSTRRANTQRITIDITDSDSESTSLITTSHKPRKPAHRRSRRKNSAAATENIKEYYQWEKNTRED